jgi:hypothetical protein
MEFEKIELEKRVTDKKVEGLIIAALIFGAAVVDVVGMKIAAAIENAPRSSQTVYIPKDFLNADQKIIFIQP